VPNDVCIAGGVREFGANDERDGNLEEEAPNVVICTGANACGKVCDVFSLFLYTVSETLRCVERLPEASEFAVISDRSKYQQRLSQTALIQYMAQVTDRSSRS